MFQFVDSAVLLTCLTGISKPGQKGYLTAPQSRTNIPPFDGKSRIPSQKKTDSDTFQPTTRWYSLVISWFIIPMNTIDITDIIPIHQP